jgi:hypothetical protein
MNSSRVESTEKEVVGLLAGGVASSLIGWAASWLSDKYTGKEAEKLDSIKKLYMVELNAKAEPEVLTLDDKGFPKKKYTDVGVTSNRIGRASDNRVGTGNYFANSKPFMGTIEIYLKARQRRSVGAGKKGDVLALVLIEWLDWANDDLPKLGYDKDSLILLEARKKYLSKLIADDYFRHSDWWRRGTTKFDTLIKLQSLLDGCIEICKQEEKKQSVREYLSKCREIGVSTLRECLTILYLLCDEKAHLNYFLPVNYISHDKGIYGKVSNDEWNIYERVSNTENGRVLKDIIQFGGLDSPGFPKATQYSSQYYDEKLKALASSWKKSDVVNFPWNNDDQTSITNQIASFQALGESVLDFTAILKILDLAYDVVGGKGDEWASRPAKELFLYALKDFEKSLKNLVERFSKFLTNQDALRGEYNHVNSVSPHKQWNPNFTLISNSIEEIQKNGSAIEKSTEAVENIIEQFPISSELLAAKEKRFSDEVKRRQGLEIPTSPSIPERPIDSNSFSQNPPNIDLLSNSLSYLNQLLSEINNFRFPIRKSLKGFVIIDKPGLKEFKDDTQMYANMFPNGWGIDNYDNWANGFLTQHKDFFVNYHTILDQLKLAIQKKDINDIVALQDNLSKIFNEISLKIDNEKPQWKFKYGFIPVRLGSPFNRLARKFAITLSHELNANFESVSAFISKIEASLKAFPAIETEEKSDESSSFQLANAVKILGVSLQSSIAKSEQLIKQLEDKRLKQQTVIINPHPIAELEETKISISEESAISTSSNDLSLSINQDSESIADEMMSWIESVYSIYTNWQKSDYFGDIKFFENPLAVELALDKILQNRELIDSDAREILVDSIFTLYKELGSCLKKSLLASPENKAKFEQVNLLVNFLKVVMEFNPEDLRHSKENLKRVCSDTFNRQAARISLSQTYQSHGLLKPNPSNRNITPSAQDDTASLSMK